MAELHACCQEAVWRHLENKTAGPHRHPEGSGAVCHPDSPAHAHTRATPALGVTHCSFFHAANEPLTIPAGKLWCSALGSSPTWEYLHGSAPQEYLGPLGPLLPAARWLLPLLPPNRTYVQQSRTHTPQGLVRVTVPWRSHGARGQEGALQSGMGRRGDIVGRT